MLMHLSLLLTLCALFIPPILAYRGKAFRGFWIIALLTGAAIALFGNGMPEYMLEKGPMAVTENGYSDKAVIRKAHAVDFLATPFGAFVLGSFMATCISRPKQEKGGIPKF
jgi:hypothetical protein